MGVIVIGTLIRTTFERQRMVEQILRTVIRIVLLFSYSRYINLKFLIFPDKATLSSVTSVFVLTATDEVNWRKACRATLWSPSLQQTDVAELGLRVSFSMQPLP